MKIEKTINDYKGFNSKYVPRGSHTNLSDYFLHVVSQMSQKAKEIIESESLGFWVTGELFLYDLLKHHGLDDINSAYVAVFFPDPLKFDPTIFGHKENFDLFKEGIKENKNPLEILIEISSNYVNKNSATENCRRRFEDFKDIVKNLNNLH